MSDQTHVRYRKRDPRAEVYAGLALIAFLGLFLLGARWLVQHRPAAAAPAATTQAVRPNPNDPVVIEINGEPVLQSEFMAAIASVPPQMRAQIENEIGKKQIAEELVKMKLLEQYARKKGLDKDPEIIGRLEMMRGNLLASAALRSIIETSPPQTIEELYEKNKAQFELANVKSILIAFQGSAAAPRNGKALPLEQARAKAQEVVARLRRGEDFAAAARTESAGNTSDLGMVGRGSLPPQFERVIFELPVGQVSDPVQSEFGFHIFKVTERKTRTLDELRPALQQEGRQLQANAIINELRKQARVEFKKPFFKG